MRVTLAMAVLAVTILVAAPPAFARLTPGTYKFVAAYSGDANNSPANSSCGDANESVTVTCTTTITGNRTGTLVLGLEVTGNHVGGAVVASGNSGTGPYPEDTGPDVSGNFHKAV